MANDKRGAGTMDGAEVARGALLGLLGSWVLYAVALMVLYASTGDGSPAWVDALIGFGALFAIPVAAGVVLIRRGRGQLGSGMLLGVAIGSIVGAGICSTVTLIP